MFRDYVKRRLRGRTEIIEHLTTEEQRVRALKEHFSIELKPEEQRAIQGMPSELKTGRADPSGLS